MEKSNRSKFVAALLDDNDPLKPRDIERFKRGIIHFVKVKGDRFFEENDMDTIFRSWADERIIHHG